MTTAGDDELDVPAFVLAAQERATEADLQRMGRVQRATDSPEDRAHLRLLIVRTLEDVAPDAPDELERIAKLAVASMRGGALRHSRDPRPGLPPPRG